MVQESPRTTPAESKMEQLASDPVVRADCTSEWRGDQRSHGKRDCPLHLAGAEHLRPLSERDEAGIDTGVEQSHRGRVSQDMGGDVFIGQGWTAGGGGAGMDGEAVFDGVSAEALAGAPGENHWCAGGASVIGME